MDSGVAIVGDRVYLREYWSARAATAEQMDRWTAERWVNDMQLQIPPALFSPAWREQLVSQGVLVSLFLLTDAAQRNCALDLQAIVSLQSAPGGDDTTGPFALGAMNLYSVQESGDDLGAHIDDFSEPVLTLTYRAQ
jgi:hypothetical protein